MSPQLTLSDYMQINQNKLDPATPAMNQNNTQPISVLNNTNPPEQFFQTTYAPETLPINNITPETISNPLRPALINNSGITPLLQDQNNFPLDYENIQTDPTITTTEKQKLGLSNILPMAMNFIIPGSGLVMKGARGLAGLNRRLRNSDFAQAKTLMDYMDMQKYGGLQGRLDAAARNMAQARGLQKQIDARTTSQRTSDDRGMGQMPASTSTPKSVGISAANQGSIDPAGAAGKGRKG